MIYADYDFYVSEYRGEISQDAFDGVIVKACAHVRRITFGRADQHVDDENVKLAVCAACDAIASFDARRKLHNGANIVSENTDGYSVSYANEQASGETTEGVISRKVYHAAEVFLLPTGLLNWGVDNDDEC